MRVLVVAVAHAILCSAARSRDASNYVHRVGRCARAGATGAAVTLVKRGQERDFARLRNGVAPRVKIPTETVGGLKPLIPDYRLCLEDLRTAAGRRGRGARKPPPAKPPSPPPPPPDAEPFPEEPKLGRQAVLNALSGAGFSLAVPLDPMDED
jgi:hypothetical protein